MKRVPSYWWDFVHYTPNIEDFFVIVESDRSDGVEYIKCIGIEEAEKIISDLNAGRMTWPES